MLTLHRVGVITKSENETASAHSKLDFNIQHIDSAKIIYNIRMFVGARHTLREWALIVRNYA